MAFTGQCNCKGVTVTLTKMPDQTILCRCDDCRTASGALHSANLFVDKKDVDIKGNMKTFEYTAISGAKHLRYFCPECGSPIQTTDDNIPFTFVKAGLFKGKGQLPKVGQVLFDKHREDWDTATWPGAQVKQTQ